MLLNIKIILPGLLLAGMCLAGQTAAAAAPVTGHDQAAAQQYAAQRQIVPLPPHWPPFLPNGATNLDYVWIEDGGARLYWNDVVVPRQLKMDGAYWQDPALVPQLFAQPAPRRRYYSPKRATKKITAPAPSSAIPLPVTPTETKAEAAKPAPEAAKKPARQVAKRSAPRAARPAPPANNAEPIPPLMPDTPRVQPPPLQ